jgi:hypothetical protein
MGVARLAKPSLARPPAVTLSMRLADDPIALWRDFAAEVGPVRMAAAYRYPVDGALYANERRWVASVGPTRVGWGALLLSNYGTSAEMRVGVFPACPYRGVSDAIRDWLITEAFCLATVEYVEAIIRATNPLAAAVVADCASGRGPWTYSGMLACPPPVRHVFVVRREDWP